MASSSKDSGGEAVASSSAGASSSADGDASTSAASAVRTPKLQEAVPPALADKPAGLPPGNYKLVGWDMDTTGRRLIDEIYQLAAYAPPNKQFSQCIMPYGDISHGSRRRHNVRVVTVGRYRKLKDTITHKILKTKSEYSALVDFLNWLQSVKSLSEMVILIYHEPRRLLPSVLIQSLIRHCLLDRFKTIVAGFTDSYFVSSEKCKGTFKSVSLRILANLLLDEHQSNTDTTLDRAIATYNIVEQLANQGVDYLDMASGGEAASLTAPSREMLECAREFARPISTEIKAYENMKDSLEKQNTYQTAFTPLPPAPPLDRERLLRLRRTLAETGLLFEQVKDAWHDGRRAGLENLMLSLEATVEPEDTQILVNLFNGFFLMEKVPKIPRGLSILTDETDEFCLSNNSDSSGQLSPTQSASGQYQLLRALSPHHTQRNIIKKNKGLAASFLIIEDDDDCYLGLEF